MYLRYTLKTAFSGLRRNTGRSLLTILGIVIGITAIMIVLSVGEGAESLILNQVSALGAQTVIVEPGRQPSGPADFAEIFTDSLKQREREALENPANVRGVDFVVPEVIAVAALSNESETTRVNVIGTAPDIQEILAISANEGTFITEDDVRQAASSVVLGATVKEDLFGSAPALGKKIKIKGRTFRVVGLIDPTGQVGFLNVDEIAIIPYTTAQRYLLGIDHFNVLWLHAESGEAVSRVVRDVELTLRELHDIDDPEKDDFHVVTQEDAIESIGIITTVLTALLTSVAAISLVVGGVGIMNIMLVSVSERTREIGLRKAVGARNEDIMAQFLIEAVMLTGIGGIVGIVLGALFSFIAALILAQVVGTDWEFIFSITAAVAGLLVASTIGLVFGIYPARQAAQKSPIEALRFE